MHATQRVLHRLDLVTPRLIVGRTGLVAIGELLERQEEISREVLERDAQALGRRCEERHVLRRRPHDPDRARARVAIGDRDDQRAFRRLDNFVMAGGHHEPPMNSSLINAVTRMLASESGSSSFQPRFIS
jgi:hypothetical protein